MNERRRDPLLGLKRLPDLWELFQRQPIVVQKAYITWWEERTERRGAHRDCLDPFLAGYHAHATRRRAA